MPVRHHTLGGFGIGCQAESFAQHDFVECKGFARALDGFRFGFGSQVQGVQMLDEGAPVFTATVGMGGRGGARRVRRCNRVFARA